MYTVLVSAVGGVIGYGIVRALRQSNKSTNIIGMDTYPDAVGQTWTNSFIHAPRVDTPEYPLFLENVLACHSVDLFIPGMVHDVEFLANNQLGRDVDQNKTQSDPRQRDSKRHKSILALNRPEVINLCGDKWKTHLLLKRAGFNTIPTFIAGEFEFLIQELGSPFLVKPRRSYGSKGIFKVHTASELEFWRQHLGNNFMVQKIVGTEPDEYTVATFGFGNGQCGDLFALNRRLGPDGSTHKARVVAKCNPDFELLEKFVRSLSEVLQPLGPTNFQFRKHEGQMLLLEVNPRISSSTSIRAAFGYNEASMCIDFFLEGKRPQFDEVISGVALRYLEDLIVIEDTRSPKASKRTHTGR